MSTRCYDDGQELIDVVESPFLMKTNDDLNAEGPSPPREGDDKQGGQEEEPSDDDVESRRRREEEESLALARALMAEEAMASYQQHFQIVRDSQQLSQEDYQAWQAALREEDHEEVEQLEDEQGDLSYDAMLQLGERIGDVKMERWAMIAKNEIEKLPTMTFEPSNMKEKDVDDSEHKCLVCQCDYDKGESLRRLPCQHCFHLGCIDQWLMEKDFCPYCRQSIAEETS